MIFWTDHSKFAGGTRIQWTSRTKNFLGNRRLSSEIVKRALEVSSPREQWENCLEYFLFHSGQVEAICPSGRLQVHLRRRAALRFGALIPNCGCNIEWTVFCWLMLTCGIARLSPTLIYRKIFFGTPRRQKKTARNSSNFINPKQFGFFKFEILKFDFLGRFWPLRNRFSLSFSGKRRAHSCIATSKRGGPWAVWIVQSWCVWCGWKGNVPLGHFYNVLVIRYSTLVVLTNMSSELKRSKSEKQRYDSST